LDRPGLGRDTYRDPRDCQLQVVCGVRWRGVSP
jgi:hypothetical protein